jgi:hypothetical protein
MHRHKRNHLQNMIKLKNVNPEHEAIHQPGRGYSPGQISTSRSRRATIHKPRGSAAATVETSLPITI